MSQAYVKLDAIYDRVIVLYTILYWCVSRGLDHGMSYKGLPLN